MTSMKSTTLVNTLSISENHISRCLLLQFQPSLPVCSLIHLVLPTYKYSYSLKFSLPPACALSRTTPIPPTVRHPFTTRVVIPVIMIIIWNVSVHTTAFMPPYGMHVTFKIKVANQFF